MALQLQVVVIAKEVLIPLDGLLSLLYLVIDERTGYLASDTGGADNQPLVVLLQLAAVGTRAHVIALGPRP